MDHKNSFFGRIRLWIKMIRYLKDWSDEELWNAYSKTTFGLFLNMSNLSMAITLWLLNREIDRRKGLIRID